MSLKLRNKLEKQKRLVYKLREDLGKLQFAKPITELNKYPNPFLRFIGIAEIGDLSNEEIDKLVYSK